MITDSLNYMKRVIKGEFVLPCCVELHPTNYCNHDCVWCIMKEQRKPLGELSHSQLKSISLQMSKDKDMKHLFISGGGEPLLNKNLFIPYEHNGKVYSTYFELLNSFDISIGISSNGELLHKLIESRSYLYIDALRISVDAGNEQQYSVLHKSKNDFYLINLVKTIEDYYCASGKSVEISYLFHEFNKGSYVDLAQSFLVSKAVSRIVVKHLIGATETFGDDYQDTVVNNIEIKFSRKKEAPVYNFSGITNTLINASGKIYPCCHKIDERDTHLLGHIDEISLRELFEKQFGRLKACKCERCGHLESNQLLSKFKEMVGEKYDLL